MMILTNTYWKNFLLILKWECEALQLINDMPMIMTFGFANSDWNNLLFECIEIHFPIK